MDARTLALPGEHRPVHEPVSRKSIGASREAKLFFAQVREDPRLEIEALSLTGQERFACVASGGCTALSLLASGAVQVTCVDVNRTQNHLVELKMASVCALPDDEVLPFLGGAPALGAWRRQRYLSLQSRLTAAARAYWAKHISSVETGVLSAGVTERFNRAVVRLCRLFIHNRKRMYELLAQPNLEAQEEFYRKVWNNRRWRTLLRLFYGKQSMSLAYAPGFYARADESSFGRGMMGLVEHSLRSVPIVDNYFAFHNITGFYPANRESALPPYLTRAGMARVRGASARGNALRLIDGSMTAFLRTSKERELDGVVLSNICEWMNDGEIEELIGAALSSCRAGAVICYRDHMGVTSFPGCYKERVSERVSKGEQLIRQDRSMVQRGFRIFEVARLSGEADVAAQ